MSLSATRVSNLVDLLRDRASELGEQVGLTFLLDGEDQRSFLSFAGLDRRARQVAAEFQRRGLEGERALLLYPPGLEYIVAYFGCLYAGVIPVPAYPPDLKRISKTVPRLMAVAEDCKPQVALTNQSILRKVRPLLFLSGRLGRLKWIGTDTLKPELADAYQSHSPKGQDIAFLQYTSGSTSAPKGVMVRHTNLMDNLKRIEENFGHSRESQGVIWLPPYHDMGLIGGILSPLYTGFPCTLMSPLDFLRRPIRWLKAVSRERATTSGGPNFAYALCLRRITEEQQQGLDLSSWEVAFNGAEPIRDNTLDAFHQRFGPHGFRSQAFYPCYGLAESTLIVSGGGKFEEPVRLEVDAQALVNNRVKKPSSPENARVLVGCGRAINEHEIVIACPDSLRRLSGQEVGEILVRGPSVAGGYWRNAQATEDSFLVRLAETGEGPYLRTGDLGFIRGGELFVCGRRKELIIIRGRNYYPQDIERAAEGAHPALRTGCMAAFSVAAGQEERLALVAEIRQPKGTDFDAVVRSLRRAVSDQLQLRLHAVGLVPKDGVPKTSSGKIQRRLSKAHFSNRKLRLVHQWCDPSAN